RALVAEHALSRCRRGAVPRFLPFRAPGHAAAAVVATALVAALVFVPRAAASEKAPLRPSPGPDEFFSSGWTPASPRERVERLADEVTNGAKPAALAAAVRKDLGAATNDDLRKLATSL